MRKSVVIRYMPEQLPSYPRPLAVSILTKLHSKMAVTHTQVSGADPGFVERGGGAAAVPFEDPLWNFKRGGGRRGRAPSLVLLEDPLWNFKRGGARPLRPPP